MFNSLLLDLLNLFPKQHKLLVLLHMIQEPKDWTGFVGRNLIAQPNFSVWIYKEIKK